MKNQIYILGKAFITFILFLLNNLIFCQTSQLTVNCDSVIQYNFLGVNAVYHGFAFMPEQINSGMTNSDRQNEFDRVFRSRLKIARTWYRPDWARGNSILNESVLTTPKMEAFYLWLEQMKNRNVDIAINLGWWITEVCDLDSPLTTELIYTNQKGDEFAEWVSESLYQLKQVKHFSNIKYGFLFTEPNNSLNPIGYTKWTWYRELALKVHNRLTSDGRRDLIKLIGPNTSGSYTYLDSAVNELNSVFDIYSRHDYNRGDYYNNNGDVYDGWYALCDSLRYAIRTTGKNVWLDEYGFNGDLDQGEPLKVTKYYANYLAQAVIASMNARNQTSFFWMLFDQKYVSPLDIEDTLEFVKGVHRTDTWKWLHDSTISNPQDPYYSWYGFSMISKYMHGENNTKVYATINSSPVYISAIETPQGEHSFLVVNASNSGRNINVNLSGENINTTLNRYLYDPSTISITSSGNLLEADKKYDNVTNNFTDFLPPKSVAIYSSLWNIRTTQINSDTIELKAITDGGTSPFTFTWYKNNIKLNNTSNTIYQNNTDYTNSSYKCVITDPSNDDTSNKIELHAIPTAPAQPVQFVNRIRDTNADGKLLLLPYDEINSGGYRF